MTLTLVSAFSGATLEFGMCGLTDLLGSTSLLRYDLSSKLAVDGLEIKRGFGVNAAPESVSPDGFVLVPDVVLALSFLIGGGSELEILIDS